MALFEKVFCDKCGRKATALSRTKFRDGKCICGKCFVGLPDILGGTVSQYTYDDYWALVDYSEQNVKTYEKRFRKTHAYGKVVLDANNGLFYVEESFFGKRLYLQLKDICQYEFQFVGETAREGFLTDKVDGKVDFLLEMNVPYFQNRVTVETNVTGRGVISRGVFRDSVEYEKPKALQRFEAVFRDAYYGALARDAEQNAYRSPFQYGTD